LDEHNEGGEGGPATKIRAERTGEFFRPKGKERNKVETRKKTKNNARKTVRAGERRRKVTGSPRVG